jgi:hypothetical protein
MLIGTPYNVQSTVFPFSAFSEVHSTRTSWNDRVNVDMWHDFGVRQLLCITRRPIHFTSIITPFYSILFPFLSEMATLPIEFLGCALYMVIPPFGTMFPGPCLAYCTSHAIYVVGTLYFVLQWDLQKDDVHGSVSGPDLPLHQPSAIAIGYVIIIPVPFHAVSSTTCIIDDNFQTRYANMLICCIYGKPTP